MLILTRKVGESIVIANDIIVKVVETGKNSIRLGIDAPREISVLRQEVFDAIQKENILSSQGTTDNIDIAKAAKLISNKDKESE
ncbi:MAG TPA: carbon storage regulator [Desulfobacter sp.]|jgi:carbon storage regulator|uniref:carbon storage regulator CsrA n=1 Tax=unclassified Desulfobacter TaxID=2634406 RepID=UPI000E87BA37|nr:MULTISPECIES: carbon storage regulator CsrA [unclassified Desulfobacter]MDQ1269952.1 carbon storage regulator [Thermodesulfobacteriota bacterium]HRF89997.1 carbon storage regulator CsrA [Desulfobacter postgatei]MBP8828578.1 carbon storage regulator CsrA [Desulfobacter sp.]MBP9597517.1 carbon storage regulator CsrA [Desulfobacter sp.]HAR33518.1 carbon storage regulator [Desulfobacter sp.]